MELDELYSSFFLPESAGLPYNSSSEHISELLALLDLCFAVAISARGGSSKTLLQAHQAGNLPDLSVAAGDIDGMLLTAVKRSGASGIYPEAKQQIKLARAHIESRVKKTGEEQRELPFEFIKEEFMLDDFESFCLLLALSSEFDRKYEAIYVWLHNNNGDFCATKWLAVKLYENLFDRQASSKARVLTGESQLCRYLLNFELVKRDRSEISGRLMLSRRVVSFLMGRNETDPKLQTFCKFVTHDEKNYVPFREEKAEQLIYFIARKAFRKRGCFVSILEGNDGIGRTTTACRAASVMGYGIFQVRLDNLLNMNSDDMKKYLDMIYAECVLHHAFPAFAVSKVREQPMGEEAANVAMSDNRTDAAAYIAGQYRFLFWLTTERDSSFLNTGAEIHRMELPMLTANERFIFWQAFMKGSSEELMSCSNRYILTPKTIKSSASLAGVIASSEKAALCGEHITRAVSMYSVNQLGSYATRINAVFTWDDLVVSDEQKRRMRMICDQVKYRSIVNEDWGFRRRSPYGRGLCALFYGSPGTGKTMAVQVMANELGLDLYRIDLSQLSSKYIGETQKNISRLFDKAKNLNAMLFFDEADAMFAKRSEVKDSHDRYANADTAFLLQKLEDHEGITILATNYVNNIDDAFKRRIRFMINFVFPDPKVRLELWRKILPDSARTDEPLDFEFFAERFELSGSNIKEILTNAAFLAASEGAGIRNKHIIEAVKLNFSKYGKQLTNEDFGYLAT